MKIRTTLIVLLLLFWMPAETTAQERKNQFHLGYNGNLINEQGFKLGYHLVTKSWNEAAAKSNRYFFINPHLSLRSRALFYTNYQASVEGGILRQGKNKRYYHALSAGISYLARYEVVSFTVDFKGDVTAKEREYWEYATPILAYEFGKDVYERIGWYTKFTYAFRIPLQESQESAAEPIIEMGLRFPIKSRNNGANE